MRGPYTSPPPVPVIPPDDRAARGSKGLWAGLGGVLTGIAAIISAVVLASGSGHPGNGSPTLTAPLPTTGSSPHTGSSTRPSDKPPSTGPSHGSTGQTPPFAVRSVEVVASPARASVTCDAEETVRVLFRATVTVNGSGRVTYQWERSDGAHGPQDTGSLTFSGAGSQQIGPMDWTLGVPVGESGRQVGYTLRVSTPDGAMTADSATATLTCR